MTTRETAGQPGGHRLNPGSEPYPQDHGRPDAGLDAGAQDRSVVPSPTASIADPGPLGLAAFAATTFLLSLFNAKIVKTESLEAVVLPLALFYGGLAQLLAGMWEFKKANTFGATAFTSFGAFWLSFAAYVKFVKPGLPAADAHTATGLFLLMFAIFTTYMFVASMRVSGAIALVFVLLTIDLLGPRHRQPQQTPRTWSRSAATSAWLPPSPPGTPRSQRSPTTPGSGRSCRRSRPRHH